MQNETTAETTMANCSNDEAMDAANDEGDLMIPLKRITSRDKQYYQLRQSL